MSDDIKKAKLDELEELKVKAAKYEEYIEREERKQEQLKAQLRQLKAKKSSEKRKLDAHRKIVVGATIMAALPEYDLTDKNTLDKFVRYINSQHDWIVKFMNKQDSQADHQSQLQPKAESEQPKQEQETKPIHIRGSLAEILGDD